eukprot:c17421_g1_i1.p2 GENE.c17421_g1_i1~~c17421_g1_i1.p2  ORF type:complete len:243 (+),score=21.94 c17421_g1_i1:1468-2196(+)
MKGYKNTFGMCHMPSNFHKLLHLLLDFLWWGPLRSHWAFPFERLYQTLMQRTGSCNRSKVVASVVKAVPNLWRTKSRRQSPQSCNLVPPPAFPLILPHKVQQLLQAGYTFVGGCTDCFGRRFVVGDKICALHGCEVPDRRSFFQLVAILQQPKITLNDTLEYFGVLRELNVSVTVTRLGISDFTEILDGLDSENENQAAFSVVSLTGETNRHMCPIGYFEGEEKIQLLPMCGPLPYQREKIC